ncbi:MAG: AAA domain-containing protein [Proteobacteria bacterium]|nr:AAA domain-containing protein [Pseudomonadota bacterium]
MLADSPDDPLGRLRASIEAIVHGKPDLVLHVLTALLARGHVLLEDVPGVGKTTLAHAVADAVGCSFGRIQFTADLLPSDILGVSIFDDQAGAFRFHPGPVFAQIVLADEINRTPPRTQSSLLEAMNEGQVSVDGELHTLPEPFCVLATQNPLEHHGTFPLPESQVDRFLMRLGVGYPDEASERMLLREATGTARKAETVLDPRQILALQNAADAIPVHPDLEDYLLAIVRATREHPDLELGASPRASQALVRAARARALLLGRDHVTPDDIRDVAEPVLAHRLVAASSADPGAGPDPERAVEALRSILATTPPPS